MKKQKNIEILFEYNKTIFYRRLIPNRTMKPYEYYMAKKHGKKICKMKSLSKMQFEKELNKYLQFIDTQIISQESKKLDLLENFGTSYN